LFCFLGREKESSTPLQTQTHHWRG